jgi:diamine N-acetyltransferase
MIHAENIRLRAVEPGDVDLLYGWENDPEIWHVSNTLAPYSRFQIEQFVLNSQQEIYATGQLRLIIETTGPGLKGEAAGTVDLFDIDPVNRRAGIGILVTNDYRNRGIATEAVEAMIGYARDTLHLHQLFCNISEDNHQSLRLFEKLGFLRCGSRREWLIAPDGWKDEYMYQLILDSFTSRA